MFLGRIALASRFAGSAFSPFAFRPAANWGVNHMVARNAAKVTSPMPLSVRTDGLVTACLVAAITWFVPQDAVFCTGLFWYWTKKADAVSPKLQQPDVKAAIEAFKKKKGVEAVTVMEGSRTWRVELA